jgi:hypothetical protein
MFIITSTLVLVIGNNYGNTSHIKDKNIANILKNVLMVNIILNIFFMALIFYTLLHLYKSTLFDLVAYNNK